MKLQALLLSMALSAAHAAPTLENVQIQSFRFTRQQAQTPPAPEIVQVIQDAQVTAFQARPGAEMARMPLATQLDRHRNLLSKQLGGSLWQISGAGDAKFENYYLTFQQGQRLVIAPLGKLERLRDGVDIVIEPGLVYNFRLAINVFNPVNGSTLHLKPARGTSGPSHALKTGDLLADVKARSFVFTHGGVEYWTLYGTDVDPLTGKLTDTRSLLFVNINGLNSKVWPIGEAALPLGSPAQATLATPVVLTRTADELIVSKTR